MQGIFWFIPGLKCLHLFSRQGLHFLGGLGLHLQLNAAASLFCISAAVGGKAAQGLQITLSKSGVERSERHRGLDS